jgi:predicted component of type VI protein secretion system
VDITTDRAKLHDLLKDLRAHWHAVQSEWNDAVRKEFEETHWDALEERVHAVLRAMERLAVVLSQARHECS